MNGAVEYFPKNTHENMVRVKISMSRMRMLVIPNYNHAKTTSDWFEHKTGWR